MMGFRASAGLRLALAAAWGAAAFGAAWGLATREATPRAVPAATEAKTEMLRVEFSATFEAEEWRATLDGAAIAVDPAKGAFDVEAKAGSVLIVEATSSDFFGERDQAMRVRVLHGGHAHEYSAWGRGDLGVRAALDEVLGE